MPVAHAPASHPAVPARAHVGRREFAIVRRVNRIRRHRGLPRLRFNRRLGFIAALHSWDLAAHGELSHSSSNGQPFYQRVGSLVHARELGETIAEVAGRGSPGAVVRAWMHSAPHRAELLSPGFRRVGVGSASSRYGTIITADFASRH